MINKFLVRLIIGLLMVSVFIMGCSSSSESETTNNYKCDHISYPGVGMCIPKAPPVITCEDTIHRNFSVFQPDPHGFDPDGNGVGCEVEEKH